MSGPPQGRKSIDIGVGICCCHPPIPCIAMTGPILTGSPTVFDNGFAVARLTDLVIGYCGHTGTLVTCSGNVRSNQLGNVRIGDQFVGCFTGVIVTGSPDTFVGTGAYSETDFGNIDDEEHNDDGLNIYPPVVGRPPTPEEIRRSELLDVSPKTVVTEDTDPTPPETTPPTDCIDVPEPPPNDFQLTTNWKLGQVSTQCALSHYRVVAQAGLTVPDIVCNLQAWCENIGEPLLAQFPGKVVVTSGFRPGSGSSQHERGQATDTQYNGFTNQQCYDAAVWVRDNLPYDQLILEYGGNRPWLHISYNRSGNRPASASNKWGTRISAGNYQWRKLVNAV